MLERTTREQQDSPESGRKYLKVTYLTIKKWMGKVAHLDSPSALSRTQHRFKPSPHHTGQSFGAMVSFSLSKKKNP